jgi:hypothetical protein
MTYAHEFNHALQDQYFDLNKIAPKHPDNADRSMAVHAVIEGDAILLQSLWGAANLSQDDIIQLARGAGGNDSLARVPLVVRAELRSLRVPPGWQQLRRRRRAPEEPARVDGTGAAL